MKKLLLLLSILFFALFVHAQNVGIGTVTPDASAILDVSSTNKGLLLPRVADTNAIAGAKPAGLTIYSNADNFLYFYNGTKWQRSAAQTQGDLWYLKNDSVNYTNKKYVGINSNLNQLQPQATLEVGGNILVQEETVQSYTAPTAPQTATMNNLPSLQYVGFSDSVNRIFDPGGPANYFNNGQGNIAVVNQFDQQGWKLHFNPADFGLNTGDTLWISDDANNFRTRYFYRVTNTLVVPNDLVLAGNNNYLYIFFRSNGDNNNQRGFDITVTKIYKTNATFPAINAVGNAFYFNPQNSALRSGRISSGQIGYNSTAMGNQTTASGLYSIAMGDRTTASGSFSTALGNFSIASGDYSMAMGTNLTASSYQDFAIGNNSNASGANSFAMGNYANASGNFSTAIGYDANSSGNFSTAMGFGTNSKSYLSTALGQYNDTIAGVSPNGFVPTDPLFYIGNGTASNALSNALVVYKNGNADINGKAKIVSAKITDTLSVAGFTRLGDAANGAPKIKMKELTGTTDVIKNGSVAISLGGVDATKIISVSTLVGIAGNVVWLPTGYDNDPRLKYNYYIHTNGNIYIQNQSTDCISAGDHICSKTVKIVITYKE